MIDVFHQLSTGLALGGGLFGALFGGGMQLVILVVWCIIVGYPFYVMATRMGHASPWFAFIPILNIVLWVQMADLEIWWVILCIICFPLYIWPAMKICEKIGKPSWIGILMIIPCVNIVVPYYMAFG